jgi:hypothetical protein
MKAKAQPIRNTSANDCPADRHFTSCIIQGKHCEKQQQQCGAVNAHVITGVAINARQQEHHAKLHPRPALQAAAAAAAAAEFTLCDNTPWPPILHDSDNAMHSPCCAALHDRSKDNTQWRYPLQQPSDAAAQHCHWCKLTAHCNPSTTIQTTFSASCSTPNLPWLYMLHNPRNCCCTHPAVLHCFKQHDRSKNDTQWRYSLQQTSYTTA